MVTVSIKINQTADKIWQALTNKTQMKEWYFDIPDFELKENAIFNFYEPGGKNEFHHQCKILEILPNKKFSHTWTHPNKSKGESIVTWLLEENNNTTTVTVNHEGIESFADAGPAFVKENYQMGWTGLSYKLKNYVNGIRTQQYKIDINAPATIVWNTLLKDETYRKWTTVFCEGTYYKGDLSAGSRIHFLTPEGKGMYSDVIFNVPNKNILFQHKGDLLNFEEQPITEETEKWSGAFENYTLNEKDGVTTLIAEVDLLPEYLTYFNEAFPKGLQIIKEISESK